MGTEDRPTNGKRGLPWKFLYLSIFICTLEPALTTIAATAIQKQFAPGSAVPFLLQLTFVAMAAMGPVMVPFAQAIVLKCIFPRLNTWTWVGCVALSVVFFLLLDSAVRNVFVGYLPNGVRSGMSLQVAAMRERLAVGLSASRIFALPWALFLSWIAVVAVVTSIAPAVALRIASGARSSTWRFVVAAVLCAIVAAVFEQVCQMTLVRHLAYTTAVNGLSGWIDFRS